MRIFVLIIFTISVIFILFTGCNSNLPDVYSFNNQINDSNADYFLNPMSIETIISSTPFYLGDYPLPGAGYEIYKKHAIKKIELIINESSKLMTEYRKLKNDLDKYTTIYLNFKDTIAEALGKKTKFGEESEDELVKLYSQMLLLEASYEAIDIAKTGDGFVDSTYNYVKVTKAVETGTKSIEYLESLIGYAVYMSKVLENEKSEAIKQAVSNFNKKMEGISIVDKKVCNVESSIISVINGIDSLNMANANLGLEAIRFVRKNIDNIKNKAKEINPNEFIGEKEIKFINQYADVFDKYSLYMEKTLLKIIPADKKNETKEPEFDTGFSMADDFNKKKYMEEKLLRIILNNDIYKAQTSFGVKWGDGKNKSSNTSFNKSKEGSWIKPEKNSGILSKGWGFIKNIGGKIQTGAGVLIDGVNTAAYTGMRTAFAFREFIRRDGNSLKDLTDDLKNEVKEVIENYKKNRSGSKVLKNAQGYLQDAGDSVGDGWKMIFEEMEDKAGVNRNTSRLAGEVGKIVGGVFTAFGQGVTRLLNKESKTEDYVRGVLEVGFSLVGGSTNIFKASAGAAGIGIGAKAFLGKLLGVLKNPKIIAKGLGKTMSKLKNLNLASIKSMVSSKLSRETLGKATGKFSEWIGKLGKSMKGNFNPGFVHKIKITTEGLKRGFLNGGGKKLVVDFIDNIVGGAADNIIVNTISDLFKEEAMKEMIDDKNMSEDDKKILIETLTVLISEEVKKQIIKVKLEELAKEVIVETIIEEIEESWEEDNKKIKTNQDYSNLKVFVNVNRDGIPYAFYSAIDSHLGYSKEYEKKLMYEDKEKNEGFWVRVDCPEGGKKERGAHWYCLPHGPYRYYERDGKTLNKTGVYNKGKKHGKFTYFVNKGSRKGQVNYFTNYRNDKKHGLSKSYSKDGKPSVVSNYKNGKKHGTQITYSNHAPGGISRKLEYKDGKSISGFYWGEHTSNGKIVSWIKRTFKENGESTEERYDKDFKIYSKTSTVYQSEKSKTNAIKYKNGMVIEVENRFDGELHGIQRRISGDFSFTENWKHGKKHGTFISKSDKVPGGIASQYEFKDGVSLGGFSWKEVKVNNKTASWDKIVVGKDNSIIKHERHKTSWGRKVWPEK